MKEALVATGDEVEEEPEDVPMSKPKKI